MAYTSKDQQREYSRQWVAKRRAAFFADKCCVHCGSTDKLELDHIDPKTKTSHSIWSWAQERREVEIAKCQVLCKTCHWQKTKAQSITQAPHGTASRYERYRCRCTDCKLAKRIKRRLWYLSRKFGRSSTSQSA